MTSYYERMGYAEDEDKWFRPFTKEEIDQLKRKINVISMGNDIGFTYSQDTAAGKPKIRFKNYETLGKDMLGIMSYYAYRDLKDLFSQSKSGIMTPLLLEYFFNKRSR
jgi:hypothetical protein